MSDKWPFRIKRTKSTYILENHLELLSLIDKENATLCAFLLVTSKLDVFVQKSFGLFLLLEFDLDRVLLLVVLEKAHLAPLILADLAVVEVDAKVFQRRLLQLNARV